MMTNLIFSHADYDDQTLIQDFFQLRPGHKLVVQLSPDCREIVFFDISSYWTLDTHYQEGGSLEEWTARVAAEFSRTCRWRLRSDARLGALLSGGLDSSCLVTEVCGQMVDPSSLETFTTSYPGRVDCDEWNYADMVNQSCGCRGNQFLPDPKEGIEALFEDCLWHSEGLTSLSFLGPKLLLNHIRDRGYKVVLNGQCGDETMFGYDWYYSFFLAHMVRRGRVKDVFRSYWDIRSHSALSALRLLEGCAYYNIPSLRTAWKLRKASRYIQKDVIACRDPRHAHDYLCVSSLEDAQRLGLTAFSLPTIVRNDDRLYMAASLESRLPFLDYRFVELAAQVLPELKIRDGYSKYIMRAAFDGRMPKEVTWRTDKMGFRAPMDLWAKRFSQDYLIDRVRTAKTSPYFKMDVLARMAQTRPDAPELFSLLQMECFARMFGVS